MSYRRLCHNYGENVGFGKTAKRAREGGHEVRRASLPMTADETVDHFTGRAISVFCIRSFISAKILICLTLLLASFERVQAQEQDPTKFNQTYENVMSKARAECDALWSDPVFDPLRDKIPLNDDNPTQQMLTNSDRLRPEDKHLADLAIKTVERCRAAFAPAYAMLPAPVNALVPGAYLRQNALIAEFYVGKITFGELNIGLSLIKGELLAALSGIPQSTRSSQSDPSSTEPLSTAQQAAPAAPQPTRIATEPAVVRQVRLALVVGNSRYSDLSKLSNPANDAHAIADKLRGIGFRTTLLLDTSEQDLRREVRKFANESGGADIALLFYAGHAAQVNGENYLLPVDMEIPPHRGRYSADGLQSR
jgi:hypothetical protein